MQGSPLMGNACKKLLFWIRMFHLSCWQHMPSNLSIEIWLLSTLYCLPAGALMEWKFKMTVICCLPVIKSISLFCLAFSLHKSNFSKRQCTCCENTQIMWIGLVNPLLTTKCSPVHNILIFSYTLEITLYTSTFTSLPPPRLLWFIISIADKICSKVGWQHK